jgi:hypothetical protein
MAYRFTNTEKWQDGWFSTLTQLQMLLFLYLCDNCDIAGFVELNVKRWAVDLNSSKETIEGALKGLERGLIYSQTNDCVYIKNFLKHQKNLPLNENNKAHIGIIRRFELYAYKFNIENINEFIEGASKGLQSPTGIGNGIGIGNGTEKEEKPKIKIPEFTEIKTYALANDRTVDVHMLELKYKAWVENGWKDGYNKPIINWKTKVLNTIPHLPKKTRSTNQSIPYDSDY